jgi:hypothetical protein
MPSAKTLKEYGVAVTAHHDAADHDPERDWATARIYACTSCDEQVMVSTADEEPKP